MKHIGSSIYSNRFLSEDLSSETSILVVPSFPRKITSFKQHELDLIRYLICEMMYSNHKCRAGANLDCVDDFIENDFYGRNDGFGVYLIEAPFLTDASVESLASSSDLESEFTQPSNDDSNSFCSLQYEHRTHLEHRFPYSFGCSSCDRRASNLEIIDPHFKMRHVDDSMSHFRYVWHAYEITRAEGVRNYPFMGKESTRFWKAAIDLQFKLNWDEYRREVLDPYFEHEIDRDHSDDEAWYEFRANEEALTRLRAESKSWYDDTFNYLNDHTFGIETLFDEDIAIFRYRIYSLQSRGKHHTVDNDMTQEYVSYNIFLDSDSEFDENSGRDSDRD